MSNIIMNAFNLVLLGPSIYGFSNTVYKAENVIPDIVNKNLDKNLVVNFNNKETQMKLKIVEKTIKLRELYLGFYFNNYREQGLDLFL